MDEIKVTRTGTVRLDLSAGVTAIINSNNGDLNLFVEIHSHGSIIRVSPSELVALAERVKKEYGIQ